MDDLDCIASLNDVLFCIIIKVKHVLYVIETIESKTYFFTPLQMSFPDENKIKILL